MLKKRFCKYTLLASWKLDLDPAWGCAGKDGPGAQRIPCGPSRKLLSPLNCIPYSTIRTDYIELLGTPVKTVT